MIHPLIRVAATQPHLLAEHVEAYAALAGEEIGRTTATLTRRAMFGALALCLAAVGVVLGGVALMLWAILPTASILAPWALWVAPALPLIGAALCALAARGNPSEPFADLKQQLAADMAMLREVSAA